MFRCAPPTGRVMLGTPMSQGLSWPGARSELFMPHRSSYEQGVPCWVELQTTDPSDAKAFYAALFGWAFDDQTLSSGDCYTLARLDGGTVAGIMRQPPELPACTPPMWFTFLAVDDLTLVVEAVAAAGGEVMTPARSVTDGRTQAIVADPTGGVVGLWQANTQPGATTVNQPGAVIWNELITSDPDRAAAFYDAVLGTTHATSAMGHGEFYTVLEVDGRPVAGAMALPEHVDVPTAWSVSFATDDIAATIAAARSLGASVRNEVASPAGPLAIIADPQGAVFQVMQPIEWPD